jgi:hypothetical protein
LSIDVADVRGHFIRNLPRNQKAGRRLARRKILNRDGWCNARCGIPVGERRGGKFQP